LLANLEERFTHRKLDCFLGVGDNILEGDDLANKAAGDVFALFWEDTAFPAEEVLSCF